jgi:hypothetical protein
MSQSSDPAAPRPPSGAAPPRPANGPVPARPAAGPAPARPALSVNVPSPLETLASPPPWTVVVSFLFWLASLVVGFAVAAYVYAKLDDLRPQLRAAVLAEDPTISADSLARVVTASVSVAFGTLLGFLVLEAVLAAMMRRGRNWARILLAALGLVSVPIFIMVRGVLSLNGPLAEDYVLLGLGLQELLMLAAVVAMFLPSANVWFRH